MKDWNYYDTIEAEFFGVEKARELRKTLTDEVDAKKMT